MRDNIRKGITVFGKCKITNKADGLNIISCFFTFGVIILINPKDALCPLNIFYEILH